MTLFRTLTPYSSLCYSLQNYPNPSIYPLLHCICFSFLPPSSFSFLIPTMLLLSTIPPRVTPFYRTELFPRLNLLFAHLYSSLLSILSLYIFLRYILHSVSCSFLQYLFPSSIFSHLALTIRFQLPLVPTSIKWDAHHRINTCTIYDTQSFLFYCTATVFGSVSLSQKGRINACLQCILQQQIANQNSKQLEY